MHWEVEQTPSPDQNGFWHCAESRFCFGDSLVSSFSSFRVYLYSMSSRLLSFTTILVVLLLASCQRDENTTTPTTLPPGRLYVCTEIKATGALKVYTQNGQLSDSVLVNSIVQRNQALGSSIVSVSDTIATLQDTVLYNLFSPDKRPFTVSMNGSEILFTAIDTLHELSSFHTLNAIISDYIETSSLVSVYQAGSMDSLVTVEKMKGTFSGNRISIPMSYFVLTQAFYGGWQSIGRLIPGQTIANPIATLEQTDTVAVLQFQMDYFLK